MINLNDIMLDLETYGNTGRSAIIAIGAVKFDPNKRNTAEELTFETSVNGKHDTKFYRVVDLQSSLDAGLEQTQSTVEWWAKQSEDARKIFTDENRVDIKTALLEFANWAGPGKRLWGNGATFDNVIIENAFKVCNVRSPFAYWNHNCYRTVKNIYEQKYGKFNTNRVGTFHNALDDSITQVLALQEMYKKLFYGPGFDFSVLATKE